MSLDAPDDIATLPGGARRIRASETLSWSAASDEKHTQWMDLDGAYEVQIYVDNKLGNSVTVQPESASQPAGNGVSGDQGSSASVSASTSEPSLNITEVMGSIRIGVTPGAQSSGDVDVEVIAVQK